MTTYYKFLSEDGVGRHSGFCWPLPDGDRPGDWVEVEGDIIPCYNGLHAVKDVEDLPRWVHEALYEIEFDGEVIDANNKVVGRRARLVRRLAAWDRTAMQLWACDVAERALPIFEKAQPVDDRPRRAVQAARLYLQGRVPSEQLLAATDAATDAAAYAADAAAYAADAAAYAADAAAYAAYATDAAAYAADAAADAADAADAPGGEKAWQGGRILEIASR